MTAIGSAATDFGSGRIGAFTARVVTGAIAVAHLDGNQDLVKRVKPELIGGKIQRGGKHVTAADG